MPNPRTFRELVHEALLDGDKGSFGRLVAMAFLFSVWGIGTAAGVVLVIGRNVGAGLMDWILSMALVATVNYGTSKGITALQNVLQTKHTGAAPVAKQVASVTKAPRPVDLVGDDAV